MSYVRIISVALCLTCASNGNWCSPAKLGTITDTLLAQSLPKLILCLLRCAFEAICVFDPRTLLQFGCCGSTNCLWSWLIHCCFRAIAPSAAWIILGILVQLPLADPH